MSISTLTRRVRGEWRPPTYHSPMAIDMSQLTPLGKRNGKAWYSYNNLELEESGGLLDPGFDIVPNGPVLKVRRDDVLFYQGFTYHEPGSFEALKAVVPAAEKPPAPQKTIDLLSRFELFTKQGAYWIRGCEPIGERLKRKGIELHLSAGGRLVITAPGGKVLWSYLDAVEALEPLLGPFLRDGKPPACEVSKHRTPVEAKSIAAPGVPWCMECQP